MLQTQVNIDTYTFPFYIHENETLSNQLQIKGFHCFNNVNLLEKFLRPGKTFIDLGANIGWYTVLAGLVLNNTCKIYSFEPDNKNIELLKHNIGLNNIMNVVLENKVIDDNNGTVNFYYNNENYGDHSISDKTYRRCFNVDSQNICFEQKESIQLDSYFSDEEFKNVDLIKFDIQGSEPRALRGMQRLLNSHRPTILLEYAPGHIYDVGSSAFEIFAFIENYRYTPYKIIEKGSEPCEIVPYSVVDMFRETFEMKSSYKSIDILMIYEQ